MKDLLNRNIKDIIRENPALKAVLAEFSIGCTECSLGSCQLKDIVEIHNLSADQELRLMRRIAEVVYPGQAVAFPVIPRKSPRKSNDIALNPPLRQLVEEHAVIKRVLRVLPALLNETDAGRSDLDVVLEECISFIREYADAFHHAKEEKILFAYFDANSEIISSFMAEHDLGRGHVVAARGALAAHGMPQVKASLLAYRTLLAEHIRKEDEILYPWMNRTLLDNQVGRLYAEFAAVNARYSDKAKHYAAWIARLEQSLAANHETVPVA